MATGTAAARLPGQSGDPVPEALNIFGAPSLPRWLAAQHLSLAFTTYQFGKLFLVGHGAGGRLAVFERTFPRCMGLWSSPDGQSMWLTSQFQVWRLENVLEPGDRHNDYDRLYVPRVGYTTGDIDAHDIAVQDDGRVVFVATAFGAVATFSDRHSIAPIWMPPFLSKLINQDRCHLNGLAIVDGQAKYVTAVSRSDVVDGWRDQRQDGGVVIDMDSNEIIATGLSMPHSPRFYRDRLWVLNSGHGQFGYIDLDEGEFVPVAFCPGYARGLTFTGNFAIVGLSQPRHDHTFAGLPLEAALNERNAKAQCGLHIIDLTTGEVVTWLRIQGAFAEMYDVAVLPGAKRPMALGFQTDEIKQLLSTEPLKARQ